MLKKSSLIFILTFVVIIFLLILNSKIMCINLNSLLTHENPNDMTLSIYYMNPYILTDIPMNINSLKEVCTHKIIIDGSSFKDHLTSLKTDYIYLNKTIINSYLNCRVYYVFESKTKGKLLDVAMWTSGGNMLVNGQEVKSSDIFYNIIMPFLPEEAARDLQKYKNTRGRFETQEDVPVCYDGGIN